MGTRRAAPLATAGRGGNTTGRLCAGRSGAETGPSPPPRLVSAGTAPAGQAKHKLTKPTAVRPAAQRPIVCGLAGKKRSAAPLIRPRESSLQGVNRRAAAPPACARRRHAAGATLQSDRCARKALLGRRSRSRSRRRHARGVP
eukprot:6020447-Pyramimonas_sp.AAC.2